eukprot:3183921-Pyramimonas_sp.AAC.1
MTMRRVVLNGCYTEGNVWARGILAGSVFGPLYLSLVPIGAIDNLYVENPRAEMCPCADDIAASSRGDLAAVAALHMKLTDETIFAYEQALEMQ